VRVGDKAVAVTAGSLAGATLITELDLGTLTVKGAAANSLVQAGAGAGADAAFGTADLGEAPLLANIMAATFGSVTDSVIAAGGTVASFKSTGAVTNSS